jgi:MFS family permease
MSLFTRITLPLAAINFINQTNRSLVAVIGPILALEFGLTAAELGLLAACFFAAYAMAQLPIGLALDLKGPRRVQATLALIAATGFIISALSDGVLMLAVGRCVAGVGVAAGLMAMLKANTQWYPKERVAAVTGAGFLPCWHYSPSWSPPGFGFPCPMRRPVSHPCRGAACARKSVNMAAFSKTRFSCAWCRRLACSPR